MGIEACCDETKIMNPEEMAGFREWDWAEKYYIFCQNGHRVKVHEFKRQRRDSNP